MDEKKEKTTQEKWNKRQTGLAVLSLGLILLGALWAIACMAEPSVYQKLRSDDYMDDPTIPFNERDNATYTFTDEWLSETHDRLIWWVVPGAMIFVCGYGFVYLPGLVGIDEKTIHKDFCKLPEKFNTEHPTWRYCPECGLKLSKLEEK